MGQSEEKTLPGEGGEGGRGVRDKKTDEQPNTMFLSFLPINALRLLKKMPKKK